MAKTTASSNIITRTKRGAEARVRQLAEELRLLFVQFPHLEDAFDPDELPIAFIVRASGERLAAAPISTAVGKPAAVRTAVGAGKTPATRGRSQARKGR